MKDRRFLIIDKTKRKDRMTLDEELAGEVRRILQVMFDSSRRLQEDNRKILMAHRLERVWSWKGWCPFRFTRVVFMVTVDGLKSSDDWPSIRQNIQAAVLALHRKPQFAHLEFVVNFDRFQYKDYSGEQENKTQCRFR